MTATGSDVEKSASEDTSECPTEQGKDLAAQIHKNDLILCTFEAVHSFDDVNTLCDQISSDEHVHWVSSIQQRVKQNGNLDELAINGTSCNVVHDLEICYERRTNLLNHFGPICVPFSGGHDCLNVQLWVNGTFNKSECTCYK